MISFYYTSIEKKENKTWASLSLHTSLAKSFYLEHRKLNAGSTHLHQSRGAAHPPGRGTSL